MTTIHVKAHTRKLKDKPADPFAAQINARLAEREQRKATGTVNEFRTTIGYVPWWKRLTRALGGKR